MECAAYRVGRITKLKGWGLTLSVVKTKLLSVGRRRSDFSCPWVNGEGDRG